MAIEDQNFVQNLETQIDIRNHQHQIDKIKTQSSSIRTKSTLKKKKRNRALTDAEICELQPQIRRSQPATNRDFGDSVADNRRR